METPSAYTSTITVENSITLKVRDNYYKFQYSETKTLLPEADVIDERIKLVGTVNETLDNQIAELLDSFK